MTTDYKMYCKNCDEKPSNISYGLEFCSKKCYNQFKKATFRCPRCEDIFPKQYGVWSKYRKANMLLCNQCHIHTRGGAKFGQSLVKRGLVRRVTARKGKVSK